MNQSVDSVGEYNGAHWQATPVPVAPEGDWTDCGESYTLVEFERIANPQWMRRVSVAAVVLLGGLLIITAGCARSGVESISNSGVSNSCAWIRPRAAPMPCRLETPGQIHSNSIQEGLQYRLYSKEQLEEQTLLTKTHGPK